MSSNVGRKPFVSNEDLKCVILERQNEIFLSENKLKSKKNDAWRKLSEDVQGKLCAATFYSKLCNPQFRNEIFNQNRKRVSSQLEDSAEISNLQNDTTVSESNELLNLVVFANKAEYEKLLISREMNTKKGIKYCYGLEPGRWQDWISNKI